jgi:CheY-like chemotaxis protein
VGDFWCARRYPCTGGLGLVHMGSTFPLAGYSIPVVEDEPLVSLDLVDLLGAAGAHVVSAKSAGEATSSLDRLQVTAAVLDINLGGHNCAAVCECLREAKYPFSSIPDTALHGMDGHMCH